MTIRDFIFQSLPLFLVFCVFYCVVLRPGRVSEGRRWASVAALAPGDKVVLACGLVGTFVALHGEQDGGEYEVSVAGGFVVRVVESGIASVVLLPPEAAEGLEAEAGP